MLRNLRKMFGLQPPLPGLEQILTDVKDGTAATKDAAEQIRDLAAQPHIPPWFPRVFRFMGITFAAVGACFAIYSASFLFGTKETPGTVIKMIGGIQQAPVVEYHVDGKRFTFRSSLSSSPPAYAVGDNVVVVYRPDNPKSVQINSFLDRWLFPTVFTGAGLMMVAFSFALPNLLRKFTGTA